MGLLKQSYFTPAKHSYLPQALETVPISLITSHNYSTEHEGRAKSRLIINMQSDKYPIPTQKKKYACIHCT